MIHQNEMLRKHALGSFRDLLVRVTRDPAMLLWLSGVGEHEGLAERELRARADGAVHARRRPRLHRGRRARAGARADRLPQRLGRRRRAEQLPLRPRAPRRAASRSVFGKKGRFDWRDSCELCLEHHEPPVVLRREAVVVLHPGPAGQARRGARCSACTCAGATRCARWWRRSCATPRFYEGPRMVKPPVVYLAGLLRGMRPRRRHRVLDLAVGHDAPAAVRTRRTSPAGRTTAGSTPAPGAARWLTAVARRCASAS